MSTLHTDTATVLTKANLERAVNIAFWKYAIAQALISAAIIVTVKFL